MEVTKCGLHLIEHIPLLQCGSDRKPTPQFCFTFTYLLHCHVDVELHHTVLAF